MASLSLLMAALVTAMVPGRYGAAARAMGWAPLGPSQWIAPARRVCARSLISEPLQPKTLNRDLEPGTWADQLALRLRLRRTSLSASCRKDNQT